MSKRNFPDFLTSYMKYSSFSESPDKFHFWTGVSIIAGALQRKVAITKPTLYFDWVPNFYIIFVAPPGIVSKSTTADIGMSLLREVDGVYFGPNTATWQALITEFGNAAVNIELPNGTNDVMSAMTIVSSELGNLLNFRDTEMVDHLVNLWDCRRGKYKKITKGNGVDEIHNPWINILACTTPEWIAGTVPEYMIGGGFTSRCVFVYGEQKRKFVAYPGLEAPTDINKTRDLLIADLREIALMQGEMTLTRDAIEWGRAWYNEHAAKAIDPDIAVSGYMARKQTHLHKLAMVLSASTSSSMSITAETLQRAKMILEGAEADMPKVFKHVGQTKETRAMDQLIDMAISAHVQGKELTYQQAYSRFSRQFSSLTFKEIVESAKATGRLMTTAMKAHVLLKPGLMAFPPKQGGDPQGR